MAVPTGPSEQRCCVVKNRFATLILFLFIGLCVTALLAANFWDTKRFTEWSAKQIDKILTDSPWARKMTVQVKP